MPNHILHRERLHNLLLFSILLNADTNSDSDTDEIQTFDRRLLVHSANNDSDPKTLVGKSVLYMT